MLTEPVKIPAYHRRRPTKEMLPMLDLWRRRTWRGAVAEVVKAQFPPAVLERAREIPAEDMFADTMSFLDGALEGHRRGSFDEERRQLELAVLTEFKAIRAFHACKPVSVEPYLKKGILPLSREWLAQEAFELFDGTIPRVEIDAAIAEADLEMRLGKIFFCTNPKNLIEEAGRYLAYGPESICCIHGKNGGRFYQARERQRERGIPTMFECAVPLARMSASWRAEVASKIVTEYFREESNEADPEPTSRDFCIGIDAPLPARNILGDFHPVIIDDIHRPLEPHVNRTTKCPFC
jgi:hypothetical protein